jgi:hypothetical protein
MAPLKRGTVSLLVIPPESALLSVKSGCVREKGRQLSEAERDQKSVRTEFVQQRSKLSLTYCTRPAR